VSTFEGLVQRRAVTGQFWSPEAGAATLPSSTHDRDLKDENRSGIFAKRFPR
jgi:hypothetical protein